MQILKLNEAEKEVSRFRSIADGSRSFEDCLRRFRGEGMSAGKAIKAVAKYAPKLYNQWNRAGRPAVL